MQQLKMIGRPETGFTIVELLIVIVVIAILAAITIVSFNGISGRANDTSVQSDLSNVAKKITSERVLSATTFPLDGTGLSTQGIKVSKGAYGTPIVSGGNYNLLYCVINNGEDFALVAGSKSGKVYVFASGAVKEFPVASWTSGWGTICPAALPGYGNVPGTWLYSNSSWQTWVAG